MTRRTIWISLLLAAACAQTAAVDDASLRVTPDDPRCTSTLVLPFPDPTIVPPKSLRRVPPVTPRGGSGGRLVRLTTVIDTSGNIPVFCGAEGDPDYVKAAMKAARRWTFEPARLGGKPVPVRFILSVNFH